MQILQPETAYHVHKIDPILNKILPTNHAAQAWPM